MGRKAQQTLINEQGKEVVLVEKSRLINNDDLINYRRMGLSCRKIGEIYGITAQSVWSRLKRLGFTENIELWRENKADILEALQYRMIKGLSDKDLKDLAKKRGMVDVGILEDKIRLIRGESTSNVNTLTVVVDAAAKRREERLRSPVDSEQTEAQEVQDADIVEDDAGITTDNVSDGV